MPTTREPPHSESVVRRSDRRDPLPPVLVRTARGLSWFVALFLIFDGAARVAGFTPYIEGMLQLGYPASLATAIGMALLLSTLIYLVPVTSVLGAVLLTGYLGGAAATQVRVQDPWFIFPIVLCAILWFGLYATDAGVRELLPLRKRTPGS